MCKLGKKFYGKLQIKLERHRFYHMGMKTWRQNFSHIFSYMVRVHGIGKKCSYYWKISQNASYANDRFYPFFTFDRNIKQVFFTKNALATNKNRKKP